MHVYVDECEVFNQIDDESLIMEFKRRKLSLKGGDIESEDLEIAEEARRELLRGRPEEALALLNMLLDPKWPYVRACQADYDEARNNQHPAQVSL